MPKCPEPSIARDATPRITSSQIKIVSATGNRITSARAKARFIRGLLDSENLVAIFISVDGFQISFLVKCECGPVPQKRILGISWGGCVLRLRDQAHSSSPFQAHLSSKNIQCTTVNNVSEPLLLELLIHRIKRIILYQQAPPFGRKPTLVCIVGAFQPVIHLSPYHHHSICRRHFPVNKLDWLIE